MVQLHTAPSGNLGIITVRGSITSCIAADLKAAVDLALRRFNRVILSLEKSTYIERDCLQFLCMTHCSAVHAHKSLIVAGAPAATPVSCAGCACSERTARSGKYCR